MLKKSQFLRNWNPFSVVIGGCSAILSTKNCSLKDALQLGQTRFLPRAFKNCLGFKPVGENEVLDVQQSYKHNDGHDGQDNRILISFSVKIVLEKSQKSVGLQNDLKLTFQDIR